MPDRDVKTIRDLVYYPYATIIARNAFAASDGESRLKLRGDRKLLDFHPAASPLCRCHTCSGTASSSGESSKAFPLLFGRPVLILPEGPLHDGVLRRSEDAKRIEGIITVAGMVDRIGKHA